MEVMDVNTETTGSCTPVYQKLLAMLKLRREVSKLGGDSASDVDERQGEAQQQAQSSSGEGPPNSDKVDISEEDDEIPSPSNDSEGEWSSSSTTTLANNENVEGSFSGAVDNVGEEDDTSRSPNVNDFFESCLDGLKNLGLSAEIENCGTSIFMPSNNPDVDDLFEDYVEIDGQYYRATALPFLGDVRAFPEDVRAHPKDEREDEIESAFKNLSEDYSCAPEREQYGFSGFMETDEQRNKIYDQWIRDIETWERNRLIWLDQIALLEGFENSCDQDRTFLVKVDDPVALPQCTSPSQGKASSISNKLTVESLNEVKETSSPFKEKYIYKDSVSAEIECKMLKDDQSDLLMCTIDGERVSWDDWYQHMRLKRHKELFDRGLSNWYGSLLEEQSSRDVSRGVGVLESGCSSDQKKMEQEGPANKIKSHWFIDQIPAENIPVYQFTDRNLWTRLPLWPKPKSSD